MKIQNTPKIYSDYYGAPIGNNPLYREPIKSERIKKNRKVEPIEKSKSIDLLV